MLQSELWVDMHAGKSSTLTQTLEHSFFQVLLHEVLFLYLKLSVLLNAHNEPFPQTLTPSNYRRNIIYQIPWHFSFIAFFYDGSSADLKHTIRHSLHIHTNRHGGQSMKRNIYIYTYIYHVYAQYLFIYIYLLLANIWLLNWRWYWCKLTFHCLVGMSFPKI